ncbi:Rab geranylgeranyltransferase BET4 PWA37_003447 [Arxiozyma heterogenica]|uniref:Geranylgeranyl transferase type-2 subunit alpha n=1 Tax=Arxiozyma heterogenica TaxID=278026 RepID=A0AAN8A8V8_9SACH|nr:hypothetical protein RI543_001916 [Kazachstania heterogenica]
MQHGIKRKQWTKELLRHKREEDKKKIETYRALVEQMLQFRDNNNYSVEAMRLTTKVLDINPEFNTAWNYRRDIITNIGNLIDEKFWQDELKFTMIQLKRFPKVYWIWNHRVWILNNIPINQLKMWQGELIVVNALLEMDARNFHGWHYRRVVISNIEKLTKNSLNKQEFEYVTSKINKNISNYSAWHQRVQLITNMLSNDQIADKYDFMNKEIEYITNAIFTDAEDQSVWFYIIWMIKFPIVKELLGQDGYSKFLKELRENAEMINMDELEFSGKDNFWCLKIILEIDMIQNSFDNLTDRSVFKGYLEKLIKLDPLRQNRYKYLLSKLS